MIKLISAALVLGAITTPAYAVMLESNNEYSAATQQYLQTQDLIDATREINNSIWELRVFGTPICPLELQALDECQTAR